ncbi:uncharacterized protein BO80DRAFT_484492 [Aspergillus ibericus CBS 121593]|uniref:P-loop containing nucleoside triphosphate hydrolase protein n=1 Tax=Aspergillus ibericus CBS 121593 TaxID=1448316 RepID=A0A395GM22_9EURO|nr:hypothetical protein BO80DRAFT_484492 [Aspergillus ibericus CBS 121593]RAK96392.1 hypothetical protein BO80DRAFT_484492 [Aspergillus ibericus CBS 121593]
MTIPTTYILIISGTHVTGKDTIATSLAHTYHCPFLEGEYSYCAAWSIARARAKHGYDTLSVFGQTWLRKMRRVGLHTPSRSSSSSSSSPPRSPSYSPPLSPLSEASTSTNLHPEKEERGGRISAIISSPAMRQPHREAIRAVMETYAVGVIFVVLQIERETLMGRTVGAENVDLERRILEEKTEDIRLPGVEEVGVGPGGGTIVVDALLDVDSVCWVVRGGVAGVVS